MIKDVLETDLFIWPPALYGNIKAFMKEGFANFSTLLISEERNTLFIGAREAIFGVDMNNISKELYNEHWMVTDERQQECTRRGKDKEAECRNYILLLHKLNNSRLYVCGTNAFHPTCDYMLLSNDGIQLEGNAQESRGKCPFGPTLRFTSLIVDGQLYSATTNNFLGSEPIIFRSLGNPLRTEFKASWLNEPSFVNMDVVLESEMNPEEDDDKMYVFFSETAIEFESYNKHLVSRIARVCKGDLGGKRILQKRWTSFLKASLICSVPESNFQFNVIQDSFLLKTSDWRETIFYGIFIQQWGKLNISAVCAYSMETIQAVFSHGRYKEPLTMEHAHVKWVTFRGEVPVPRPGACVNGFARSLGYNTSLDLPDKTLQFVKDHPLLDDPVNPIGNRPVLIKRGANYIKLVVDRIVGLDKQAYEVMFLGTDNGYLHKAVSCDSEMFIIEESQLFQSPDPVQSLKLSSKKGFLYVGSPSQVVQLPVAVCSRYTNCMDCVLSRDPYCAWSRERQECVTVADHTGDFKAMIQSVKNGDASECPKVGNHIQDRSVLYGNSVRLSCTPVSNLAHTKWIFNGNSLHTDGPKYLLYEHGMVIFNVTVADRGLYDCQSVERANGKEFFLVAASYALNPKKEGKHIIPFHPLTEYPKDAMGKNKLFAVPDELARQTSPDVSVDLAFKVIVAVLAFLLFSLLTWNLTKGHIVLPCVAKSVHCKPSQGRRLNVHRMPNNASAASRSVIVNLLAPHSFSENIQYVHPNHSKNVNVNNNSGAKFSASPTDVSLSFGPDAAAGHVAYIEMETTT
ncbi:semaphorin-4E-like isoform X2 [Ascaphus truei]|uniref:semaphorin-4E-like isoform X2 n=1 Tax=Ascaphus truei TaxID=8439 RepID=UPI003F59C0B8